MLKDNQANGFSRGAFTDWLTQRWVEWSGRRWQPETDPWLDAPTGDTGVIGPEVFDRYAARTGWSVNRSGMDAGLIPDFSVLSGSSCDVDRLHPEVKAFYTETSSFSLDVWAEWRTWMKPVGWLVKTLFSRRLQQLNMPLSSLDPSGGITSEVLPIEDHQGRRVMTAWVRKLLRTNEWLYAGAYTSVRLPQYPDPCVKVTFPLPNGNALVMLWPESHPDGSLTLHSQGKGFGEPGFYFTTLNPDGTRSARYVRTMQEHIHVFSAEDGTVRADHDMFVFGIRFLKLHYRMRRKS